MVNKEAERDMAFVAFWGEVGKEAEKIMGKKITVLAAWELDDEFSNKVAVELERLGAEVTVLNQANSTFGNEFSNLDLIESTDVCLLIPPKSNPSENNSQNSVLFQTVKRMSKDYFHKIVIISQDENQNEMLMFRQIMDRVTIGEAGAAALLTNAISGIAKIRY